MRLSGGVIGFLYGGGAVSALSLPNFFPRAVRHVDLAPFEEGSFTLLPPEQAAADAQKEDQFDASKVTQPSEVGTGSMGTEAMAAGEDAAAAGTCETPAIRTEWRDLADADKKAFIDAVKCLIGKPASGNFENSHNRYEDLVWVHQQMTNEIHMVAQFLPYHRYYLSVFEAELRDQCGFEGALPWWDETKDAGNFAKAPLFTDDYFGPLPAKTEDGGTCIETGAFGGLTLHIGPGGAFTDHCLSRALDESLTAQSNSDFVSNCNSHSNYSEMESCAEMGPHAYTHNGIGAVMADVASSPGDPIFFMHHAFVDHNWRIWQNPDPDNRLYQINGYSTKTDPKQSLTLDYVLTSKGIRPDVTVQEVMNTLGGYLCYRYNY
ncbi:putative tyrosinase protein [Phaeoacremonium minimum UCRPA7]|uniref:Putative tyrosinase protein n=1 Tax=Phaeoacremonium minimum (strain UCR-PA7) TaxID=1286976 RepID=R8BCN1_PHAM7|nr:putative tyrosinase protein [Phaeoacremonium minimum UCRPA7]EON97069.1 putative tyrosinase protein [Phaeoacremonium minimum UCRPA7]